MALRFYSLLLVLVNIVLFIVQNMIPGFTESLVLVSADVFSRPWILISSVFLHGSTEHLIYNMMALALFGFILENIVGSRKFLIAYFLAGIVSGIGSTFFYTSVLGASGAIFGIQGYLAARRPTMMMWVYGAPMPMFVAVILWTLFNFAGVFFPGSIAFASHLFGLVFGIAFGLLVHGLPERPPKIEKQTHPTDEELDAWEDVYMKRR